MREGSAPVIVNTKPGDRKLYRELVARGEDVILLTQHLCPKHRLDLIRQIKYKLKAKRQCAYNASAQLLYLPETGRNTASGPLS